MNYHQLKEKINFEAIVTLLIIIGLIIILYPRKSITPQKISQSIITQKPTPTTFIITDKLFLMINGQRKDKGLNKLKWDKKIETGVNKRVKELQERGIVAYQEVEKLSSEYFSQYAGKEAKGMETLARDFTNDEAIFNAWKESPPHYEIMFNPIYTRGAIGRYKNYVVLWLATD